MAEKLKVAGVQMLVGEDVGENESRILAAIERAAGDGVELLLTPEGSLSGYHAGFDRGEVAAAVERVRSEAADAGVGLALGTCYKEVENDAEYCYNQVRVYTPKGEYLGFHAKILRCSPLDHPGTGEMRDYVEGKLRTFIWRGLTIGALICNDLWATPGYTTMPNPYLPWKLRQMGAQMLLHAVNSGGNNRHRPFHESSRQIWARVLQVPIVYANAAHEDRPVNALSGVTGADGVSLVTAPDQGEQYFTCEVTVGD